MEFTVEGLFGPGANPLGNAQAFAASSDTPAAPAIATTDATNSSPDNPLRALLDPRDSALFWIGLAAILGLLLVTGQLKVSAAVAAKTSKKGR